jgi:hypothetical protein
MTTRSRTRPGALEASLAKRMAERASSAMPWREGFGSAVAAVVERQQVVPVVYEPHQRAVMRREVGGVAVELEHHALDGRLTRTE